MVSASGVYEFARIAFTCDWIVAGAVPMADSSVPPVSPLKIITPKSIAPPLASTVFTACFAIWMRVTAGIAALAGPLHGGANTNVMKMLIEIDDPANVDAWVEKALSEKRKIMGIGHAVYKTEDPRATWLRKFSKQMADKTGVSKWYEMSQRIEQLMHEKKGMYPNVDFYSASTYYLMGIPLDLYTPIFAVSRISGWTGHILEQYANNKLIRPRAEYIGKRGLKYVPVAER